MMTWPSYFTQDFHLFTLIVPNVSELKWSMYLFIFYIFNLICKYYRGQNRKQEEGILVSSFTTVNLYTNIKYVKRDEVESSCIQCFDM